MKQQKLAAALGAALALGYAFSAGAAGPDPDRHIVQFKSDSKAQVRNALQAAGARFHHELDSVNAFAVTVPAQALNGLRNNPNITLIEQDVARYPLAETVPYGIVNTQANLAVAAGATGAGVKVCVIDSGIKQNHEDFAGISMTGHASSGQSWNTDSCGHGTHVAGTINAVGGNGKGVVGVSPGAASFHIVKVFDGEACGWSYSSDLINAAQNCQSNGAKIISMSLGGSFSSSAENTAFNNLNNAGVLSIAAAGNGGNNRHSYPASYSSVMSVAAVDANNVKADFSQYNNQVEISAPGVSVLSTYPISSGSVSVTGHGTFMASAMEGSPGGPASGGLVNGGRCTSSGSWSGKTVLCERGDISFADKVLNAQSGGAAAAIVYNNAAGGFSGTLGGVATTIPSVSMSQEDGQYLVGNAIGASATVDARTSSNANGYAFLDGTSMATPHVSGVAALLWSTNSALTNNDIRNAINSTALDLGAAGRDNNYGYGLVQAKAALDYLAGSEPPPPPPGGDASVQSVSLAFSKKGPNFRALGTAVVTPAGATVTGCFTGAAPGCGTGTANSQGSITFQSGNFRSGSVTFCVTQVNDTSFTNEHCVSGTP